MPELTGTEGELLRALGAAIDGAPRKIVQIEVGIALSIALGKQRPSVSCGGCQTPLEYRGIPAVTTVGLREPFRLTLSDS